MTLSTQPNPHKEITLSRILGLADITMIGVGAMLRETVLSPVRRSPKLTE